MIKLKYYTTYKFYNHLGNRCSIFAKEVDKNQIEIVVIPCSHRDTFKKRVGRNMYEMEEYNDKNSSIFYVDIDNNKPGQTFINWCKEHYRRKHLVALTDGDNMMFIEHLGFNPLKEVAFVEIKLPDNDESDNDINFN